MKIDNPQEPILPRPAITKQCLRNAQSKGFTLTELMVTLSILVILLSIAVPSYSTITASSRIAYEVNDLRGHIELARSEALKQGLTVIICASSDAQKCDDGTSWANGWIVFSAGVCTETNSKAAGATLIKVKQAFTSTDTAVYTPNTKGYNTLCFTRMGLLASSYTGWFSVNTSPVRTSANRCITTMTSGGASIVKNGAAVTSATNCS